MHSKMAWALVRMRNVKFKLDVAPFRGDGGENVKVTVKVSESGRMSYSPVDPGGNFPACGTPDVPKKGGQLGVFLEVRVGLHQSPI